MRACLSRRLAQQSGAEAAADALKAIVTQDHPDKKGKGVTYGITVEKGNVPFNFVMYAYGLPHGDWVLDGGGKVA